jgi:hypothetical protein
MTSSLEERTMVDDDVGYVYILKNEAMPGIYKIGITSRDSLSKRINELYNGQTNIPLPFECVFACKVKSYKQAEKAIHNAFHDHRINPNREFFKVAPERVIPLLQLLQIEEATSGISEQISKKTSEADKQANINYIKRRPNFNFVEMGISVGETIVFADDSKPVEAEIVSDRLVKYDGKEYTLTKLTAELLGLSYSVAPMPWWKYNGKSLREYYNETYPDIE